MVGKTEFAIAQYDVFTQEEHAFLAGIFAHHPAIATNFERYLTASADARLAMAFRDLAETPRTGWVRRNVPNPEHVKLHTDYVEKYAFAEAPVGVDAYRAQAMAAIHDIPEAIVTDFTPTDPISKEEKAALEVLAMKVIYQSSPRLNEILSLVQEYEEQQTPESQWVHDVDTLDPLFVALQYEAKYPETMGLFKEFADDAGPRLKTAKGKTLYGDLVENQAGYRQAHRDAFHTDARTQRGAWARRA
jgi:5'-deoxynucleotidase YfbR-like HD superfamily hydrolase